MSYVKSYDVGSIRLDAPRTHFIYELPLLSFGDIKHTIGLSLIFQSKTTENAFYISKGYRLNLMKRLIVDAGGIPEYFEESDGTQLPLNDFGDRFTFNDKSQRVVRKFGDNTFRIDYPDLSAERYDNYGRIIAVIDKYGETYLTYSYSAYGKLNSITYRGNKVISFSYNENIGMLQTIRYICDGQAVCTSSLSYPGSANVTVSHYSGVDYYITYYNGSFTAYSTDSGATYSNVYSNKLRCNIATDSNGRKNIAVVKTIGTKDVDRVTYTFLDANSADKFSVVNITDFNGVVTRIQYENEKPKYTYEVMNITDDEYEDIFFENNGIDIYKGTVYINKDEIKGKQTVNDGMKMTHAGGYANSYSAIFSNAQNLYGNFQISGWISPVSLTSCVVTVKDSQSGVTFCEQTIDNLIPEVWNYFSFRCYISNPNIISVLLNYDQSHLPSRDFRITFEDGKIYQDSEVNHYTVSKGILVKEGTNASNEKVLSMEDNLRYYVNGTQVNYRFTAEDLLRYKINQKYGTYKNEVYYDNCKGIHTSVSAFEVEYTNDNGSNVKLSVDNLAVGKSHIIKDKTYLTKSNFYSGANNSVYYASSSYVNNEKAVSVTYDNNLDVTSSTSEGVTISYVRSNGLVTSESVPNLYTRTYAYGEDDSGNTTITVTDEFNNQTVYTMDSVWGRINKTVMDDGAIVEDTFDSDMCSIVGREFSDADENSKTHSFDYSNGNLSELAIGDLNYEFSYSNGSLSVVSKCTSPIESHILENNDKKLKSFYPSQNGCVYSIIQNTDEYGRLTEIDGILKNVYDINPIYSNGTHITFGVNNSSSKLAETEDFTTGNIRKYAYLNDRVSNVTEFNSSETKLNEQAFVYDDAGRLKENTYNYDISNSKSVKLTVNYEKAATEADADNRVSSCSFKLIKKVNNADVVEKSATIANTFDTYKRILTKSTTLAATPYVKTFTYDKTRVSSVAEAYSTVNVGTDSYTYDGLGRVLSHAYSSSYKSYNLSYEYDSFGQLIRENNQGLDKTYVYEYNGIGNITSVKAYAYTTATTPSGSYTTTSLTYGSSISDRLTKYGINNISYNSIGYPTAIGNKKYVWTKGKLTRIYDDVDENSSNSAEDIRFTYNAYGQRVTKTYSYDPGEDYSGDFMEGSTTSYDYDESGRLIREYCTERYYESDNITREFIYLYDESGMIGVLYSLNGATAQPYYYRRNPQGDVIAIYNEYCHRKAEYVYDAFGNCKIVNSNDNDLAKNNPIRYRGYYYDIDTGLYYLNSRYYNPLWRRFISPASTKLLDSKTINGLNLYSFANNNPISISYSGSSASGSIETVNSIGKSNISPDGNLSRIQLAFDPNFLGSLFAHNENVFSTGAGIVEVVRKYQGFEQLEALSKISKVLMHFGYWLNIGLSLHNNFSNEELSFREQSVSFVVDAVHNTGQTVGSYFLSFVPLAGPFLAIAVPITVDYLWSGELCIFGFDINVEPIELQGKTAEEWVKYWVNSWFE